MADAGQIDKAVAEFSSLTGATPEEAIFYLEAANYAVSDAVSHYFDAMDGGSTKIPTESKQFTPVVNVGPSSSNSNRNVSNDGPIIPRNDGRAVKGDGGRIRQLRDIHNENDRSGSSGNDGPPPNQYFAGGGKNSGISIEDPHSGPKNTQRALVDQILQKARENAMQARNGDEENEDDEDEDSMNFAPADKKQKQKVKSFTGIGYRLGSEEDDQQNTSSSQMQQQQVPQTQQQQSRNQTASRMEVVTRTLIFWRNGFSIDDGELMSYDNPENQELLKQIKSGRAPVHLLNVQFGQPVEVTVSEKFDQDYKPPPLKPFSGSGNRLGSAIPGEHVVLPGSFPETQTSSSTPSATHSPRAIEHQVNESEPVTVLQIRLVDGTKLVSKFNHTHTIGDVRRFVELSHPGLSRPWTLQTNFPMRELQENSTTLKEANLLNAVVIQKYTS